MEIDPAYLFRALDFAAAARRKAETATRYPRLVVLDNTWCRQLTEDSAFEPVTPREAATMLGLEAA